MIKVRFHTNLDLHQAEKWPTELSCRPIKGDFVESLYEWKYGFRDPVTGIQQELSPPRVLRLMVVSVTLFREYVEAELHLPPHSWENLSQFYRQWYEPLTGRTYI